MIWLLFPAAAAAIAAYKLIQSDPDPTPPPKPSATPPATQRNTTAPLSPQPWLHFKVEADARLKSLRGKVCEIMHRYDCAGTDDFMLMLPIQVVAARDAVSRSGIAEYLVMPHAEARLAAALPVEAIGSLIDAVDDGHTARLKKARELQAAELAELRSLQAESRTSDLMCPFTRSRRASSRLRASARRAT